MDIKHVQIITDKRLIVFTKQLQKKSNNKSFFCLSKVSMIKNKTDLKVETWYFGGERPSDQGFEQIVQVAGPVNFETKSGYFAC